MSLTRKQMAEIVAFDWKRRTGLDFDGRRYGSLTGKSAPHLTQTCERCHASDVYKGKDKPARKTLRYNYIVADRARGKARPDVTVVHVAVRLNGAYQPVVKDVGRWSIKAGQLELRDIDYHGLGGWIVEWDKEDWSSKRPARRAGDYAGIVLDRGWSKPIHGVKFGAGLKFPFHETVNPEALKGTRYEWCQYAAAAPCEAGIVDWLMLYRDEPKVELLAKAGLYQFICPAGIKALKDKSVMGFLIANREEAARRNRDGTMRYAVADIAYAARHGVTMDKAKAYNDFVLKARHFIGGGPWKIDYERLRRALGKWRVGIEEYSRWLEYAHGAGLDMRNEGTLYPPTKGGRAAFMERLERMEARARRVARAKIRRERMKREAEEKWIRDTMGTRVQELKAFQESVKRTDILNGSGYTIILAKTQKELLAEGRKMGNCVGCGTYGKAVVKGDSLIVMLKNRAGSYCDIEIDRRRWSVKQCYLKHNAPAPDEVRELADRLAAWFKEEHRRHMKRGMFKDLLKKAV